MAAMAQRLLLSPSPELLGPMRRTASSSLSSLSSVPAALQRLQGQGTRAGQSRKPMAACFFGSKATATDKRQEEGRPVVEEAKAQVLYVYEINDRDRYSPVLLRSPENRQAPGLTGVVDATGLPVLAIGDLVPFSNKLYDGSLTLRVGITAGFSNVIATVPDKGQRYEAFYSFYFGDLGHISVQGPYITYQDSELAVTGGSGIFRGVYGYVKLHQIVFPIKLFYTFYLFGTPKLPEILKKKHVEPTVDAVPSTAAREARPEASLPNYSN